MNRFLRGQTLLTLAALVVFAGCSSKHQTSGETESQQTASGQERASHQDIRVNQVTTQNIDNSTTLYVQQRVENTQTTQNNLQVSNTASGPVRAVVVTEGDSTTSSLVIPHTLVVQAGPVERNTATPLVRLGARSGSKMRIEGTSNIHDWQVESPLIGGAIDVGSNFPLLPGQQVTQGPVDARGEVFVSVRSLKSVEKDGKPYSDKMDEIMYEKLLAMKSPRILFKVEGLSAKSSPKFAADPYAFDAAGQLTIAGVTRPLILPVSVMPTEGGKIKISGVTSLKMTDFNIEPPSPKGLGMFIKTGDDVKILFDWVVAPRATNTAAR